jgi:predicted amidohydrolase YtcJ
LTAAVLEPYLDASGAPTANRGLSFFGAEEVVEIVDAITRAGFQTHFHALGDRAVREALDAVEAVARRLGGDAIARLRPILSHIQLVDPADMGRFAALGAVASAQPYWAVMDAVQTDLTLPFIGPGRGALQYPFGDLWRAGARLAGGSDWPVSTPDPIQGVHTAVNRSLPGPAGAAGRLGPAQALTLAQALTAYTLGSAFANHREDESGALEVGLAGDLAVLDRDPFAAPPESIGQARVAMTLIDGRVVHQL